MKLCLGSSCRDSHHGRDLLMLIPLDIIENENVSRSGGKRSESHFEIKRCIRVLSGISGCHYVTASSEGVSFRNRLTSRAAVFHHNIDRQAIQPTRKLAFPSKRSHFVPHTNEYILRQLPLRAVRRLQVGGRLHTLVPHGDGISARKRRDRPAGRSRSVLLPSEPLLPAP